VDVEQKWEWQSDRDPLVMVLAPHLGPKSVDKPNRRAALTALTYSHVGEFDLDLDTRLTLA
jgi:hypothetical protein